MRILIAGAGIAGLGAALALAGEGRTVEVIDRDLAPPEGAMNEIFDQWQRRGATQLRHSHLFSSRITHLIRKNYPELYQRLLASGMRELNFEKMLWPSLRAKYRPEPIDDEWKAMICRRTTLEAVIRKYAEERSGAVFRSGYGVSGAVCARGADGTPVAKAFKVETPDGREETWEADLLIDASGRNSNVAEWLKAYGVEPAIEQAPVGIIYYTRHYRLHPGQAAPEDLPGLSDLGSVRGGVYPGDGGNFTITLQVPEAETKVRRAIVHPDVFETYARLLPGVGKFIEPTLAFPVGKVLGMGGLSNVWRHWTEDGRPVVLNFFALGDATMRTNPAYGRGCTVGMVHAHLLADVIRETDDRAAQATLFARRSEAVLRPFYDLMVRQDQASIRRFEALQNPNPKAKVGFRAKLMRSFSEDAIMPAVRSDIRVARAMYRSGNMLDGPNWMRKPGVLPSILATWAKPRRFKRHLYSQVAGFPRAEILKIADEKLQALAQVKAVGRPY